MTRALSPLPRSVDEITPEWLTAALAARHPGVRVATLEADDVLAGSATKIRLSVEYDEQPIDGPAPKSLIVKSCFDEAMRPLSETPNATEVRFFSDVAPLLGDIEIPVCHGAATDDTGQSTLLLEDLGERDATYGRATEPLGVDTVALALEQQARFHARWWDDPTGEPAGLEIGAVGLRAVMEFILGPESWEQALTLPRADHVPAHLEDRERIQSAVLRLWEQDAEPPHCLIHGDAHLGNLYFLADGRPGHLDWQTAQRGHWAHDVAYFVTGALTVEDRRSHDRELLGHYLDALSSLGVETPDPDRAWVDFRRHLVHGFTWLVCPTTMQPEDVCAANTKRFAAAVDDLDVLALLER